MNKHHAINYIEFPATDLPAIKEFYGKAFGWTFTDYGPEYVAFSDGVLDGGFTKGSAIQEGGPLVILYSENLETSVETVTACGATIIKHIYSFPGGRRFHFLDPAGNHLSIWSDR
ncbi:VOC family protein [Patescibacteria group bacterium]|nr:VOC family protein [Patescibacteria group bacterium]MBU2159254.1 VOC family protein [Patescibacteria group bacterium]MBU2220670.1 VOC family protein [Patescibacteria group bacterium]